MGIFFFETYFYSQQDFENFFNVEYFMEYLRVLVLGSFIWITNFSFLAWRSVSTGHISQEIMRICLNTHYL